MRLLTCLLVFSFEMYGIVSVFMKYHCDMFVNMHVQMVCCSCDSCEIFQELFVLFIDVQADLVVVKKLKCSSVFMLIVHFGPWGAWLFPVLLEKPFDFLLRNLLPGFKSLTVIVRPHCCLQQPP